jgi:hypothetical protein
MYSPYPIPPAPRRDVPQLASADVTRRQSHRGGPRGGGSQDTDGGLAALWRRVSVGEPDSGCLHWPVRGPERVAGPWSASLERPMLIVSYTVSDAFRQIHRFSF